MPLCKIKVLGNNIKNILYRSLIVSVTLQLFPSFTRVLERMALTLKLVVVAYQPLMAG